MGGGDLNLKKSWHPSTMKNMEKVWKAEQQDHAEKRKIAELKREIEMERDREDMTTYAMEQGVIEKKDDKKLDWMYKGPNCSVNREEYLLGKPIDKSFEQAAHAEKNVELNRVPKNHVEYECVPPSLRYFSGSEQVDLARKMQEDPLYAIKKKEMESRTQLLKNPVKLKQLKELLEQQRKKSKIDKKLKKKKKHASKNESNSDDELDALLALKYKKLKNKISSKDLLKKLKKHKNEKKKKVKRKESSSSSSNSSSSSSSSSSNSSSSSHSENSDDSDNDVKKRKKRSSLFQEKKRKSKYDDEKRHEKERESYNEKSNLKNRGKTENKYCDVEELHHSSQRKNRSKSSKYDDKNRDKSGMKNYGLMRADGTKMPSPSRRHFSPTKYKVSVLNSVKKEEKRWLPPKREKLTEEEKERRRREMMENASWRDKERTKNVQRYRNEEKKEQIDKIYNKDFMRKHLAAAAESGSLESRIKSNMNNIQRSKHAMDSNFAKR